MYNKAVVAAVGAVAAVGVAIGWRAFRCDRRGADDGDPTAREPLLFEDVDAERFVEGLTEATTYRTVVLDDGTYDAGAFDALGAMLARRYPRGHAELQRRATSDVALLERAGGARFAVRGIAGSHVTIDQRRAARILAAQPRRFRPSGFFYPAGGRSNQ